MTPIGVALGPDRLVAMLPGGRQLDSTDVADPRRTFAELRSASGLASARVSIALIPPLVDLRRVTLPPLRVEERRRVLERDAARYFVGARDAQVVASEGSLAAAAPARLIEELEGAVAECGWTLSTIVPAHVAWAARLGNGHHAVRLPHATEVLRVSEGRLVERARLRTGESPGDATISDIDPYAVAAEYAPRVAPGLELCSATRRAARRLAAKRMSAALGAAAALCVLLAAGVDYWRLGHELRILRGRRAALAAEVAAAMQLRDSISRATELAQTIGRLDASSPSWSSLFTDLTDDLPRDAQVAAFEARSDSFAITGVAREATGVLRGLERISRITRIRADGPIRQEVTPDGVVREHFRFAARLAP